MASAIFIRTFTGLLADITSELKTAERHLQAIEGRLKTPPEPDAHGVAEAYRLAVLARMKITTTLSLLNGPE